MNDRIELRHIRAYGRHGANPGERDRVQPFDVDVRLELDLTAARTSDELCDTIDYAGLYHRIVTLVAGQSYRLLERLGEEIVREAMRDERVREAHVTIAKPRLLGGATPAVGVSSRRAT